MANLISTNVEDNEIVKAVDFNNGFDSTIGNVTKLARSIFESTQDFVIGGKLTPVASSWNVNVAPLFGACHSTGVPFCDTEINLNVSVNPGDTSGGDKYGILEVQGDYETFNNQQRAFLDPDTETQTYQYVDTQKKLSVKFHAAFSNAGTVIAPSKTTGWVKLAEIYAPQGANSLDDCTIYNISADVVGDANIGWTNDQTATYDVGYISDVNARFRQQHNENGTHKAAVIGASNIKIGVGTDNVNGAVLPVGTSITVDDTVKTSTDTIASLIALCASKITTVFADYYNKGGKYNFNGEIKISDIYDTPNNVLTNALKIGAVGNGTAYLKIGNTVVLQITADGKLQTSGYTATANNDIVTKAVTDAISLAVTNLDTRLTNFINQVGDISSYANSLLSRYSISNATIQAISTANIVNLSDETVIDGVVCYDTYIVLLKDQTDPKENGIWEVKANAPWERVSGMDSASFYRYKYFTTSNGTTNKGKLFYCPDPLVDGYTPDVTELTFLEANISIDRQVNKIPMRDSNGDINAGLTGAGEIAFMKKVFRVHSLHWSSDINDNPQNWYPAGTWTWVQLKGAFIWAADPQSDTVTPASTTDVTKQGGAATVTIGTSNLPTHTHTLSSHKHALGGIQVDTGGAWSFAIRRSDFSSNPESVYGGTATSVTTDSDSRATFDNGDTSKTRQVVSHSGHKHTFASGTWSGTPDKDYTGDGGFSNTALDIKNPYINRYCWERVS